MSNLQIFIVTTIIVLFVFSCRSKTYKLSDTDFDWIPYKGRDTLVFTSNTGDMDTLFISKGKRYMYSGDPLDATPDSTERFHISYKFSYADTSNGMKSIPEEILLAMQRTESKKTKIGFGVVTNDAFFYGLRYFDINELNKMKLTTLRTDLKNYDDIFIIEPDTANTKYSTL